MDILQQLVTALSALVITLSAHVAALPQVAGNQNMAQVYGAVSNVSQNSLLPSHTTYTCTFGTTHSHGSDGILTPEFKDGKLTGFKCSISSHDECFAGADGVWKTCTFRPQDHSWPVPVSKNVILEIIK